MYAYATTWMLVEVILTNIRGSCFLLVLSCVRHYTLSFLTCTSSFFTHTFTDQHIIKPSRWKLTFGGALLRWRRHGRSNGETARHGTVSNKWSAPQSQCMIHPSVTRSTLVVCSLKIMTNECPVQTRKRHSYSTLARPQHSTTVHAVNK